MKNTFYILFLSLFILSCSTTETKSENHRGIIEQNDAKSSLMDAFNSS